MEISAPMLARHFTAIAGCVSTILLGACSLAPGGERIESSMVAASATGIADRQSFNDQKADVLLRLACDISIGAYYRLRSPVQQEALSMLCSGRRPYEGAPALIPRAYIAK